MRNWNNVLQADIVSNKTLLAEFVKDYEREFKDKLTVGCNACIRDAYTRLISFNLKPNKMKEIKFKLKPKYNGIIWKNNPVNNGNLTDKLAKELYGKHPRGKDLFEIYKLQIQKKKTKR